MNTPDRRGTLSFPVKTSVDHPSGRHAQAT
jgi:hypothetical protein